MLSCREVAQVCSDEMERPLGLGEKMGLRIHLMMCPGCTNYRRQLQTLREAMRAYADGKGEGGDPGTGRGDVSN